MGIKCKDLETLVPETMVEKTQFEVELPNEEDEDVEDEASTSDTSETQPVVDPDYLLARDRERRTITAPSRYGYADLVCFALNAVEDVQDSEPRNFKEAFESKESKYWLKAVNPFQKWFNYPRPKPTRTYNTRANKNKEHISLNKKSTSILEEPQQQAPRMQFDPIPMTYAELLPILLDKNLVKTRTPPPVPNELLVWYQADLACAFHQGAPGHDIEHCFSLKIEVHKLIDDDVLSFKNLNPSV
ncbi:hypothetical protein MTR_1g050415 [Medicago truncatula]|uniref:Uncharacterized protein n=1 Tax=Medicago truncatula TaxID=3880 RepID=A0A072VJ10_MEDTR|nr:hypothetical protein MTR_1g050415 [Medicago truncatula]